MNFIRTALVLLKLSLGAVSHALLACSLLAAVHLTAGAAEAPADSLEGEPDPAASPQAAEPAVEPAAGKAPDPGLRLQSLLPRSILLGPQVGFLGTRFRSSGDYRALLEPTEARDGAWKSASWGAIVSLRWNHGFSLTLAPRREAYGIETREETVAFQGNPFPHTLEAKTRLDYLVWPLQAGMGWQGARQRFDVALGVYKASFLAGDVRWIVDGEEYANRPAVKPAGNHYGWLVSTGYGFRLGAGELHVGVEAQQATGNVLQGMEGEVKARSWRALAAYLWTLPSR